VQVRTRNGEQTAFLVGAGMLVHKRLASHPLLWLGIQSSCAYFGAGKLPVVIDMQFETLVRINFKEPFFQTANVN